MLCAMYGRWYIGMLLGVLGATGFDMPCFVRIYLCDISCRVFQSVSSDGQGWLNGRSCCPVRREARSLCMRESSVLAGRDPDPDPDPDPDSDSDPDQRLPG